MNNLILFLILLALYFMGSIIYCLLNMHRVGRKDEDDAWSKTIEAQDIVSESSLWLGYWVAYIILSPYKLLTKLIEFLCGQKKH